MRADRHRPTTDTAAPAHAVADGACAAAVERVRSSDEGIRDDALATFRARFRDAAYYSSGRGWEDYAPAYRCGMQAFAQRHVGKLRFGDLEPSLADAWPAMRGDSRLGWAEARGAALDAWLRQCDAQSVGVDRRSGARRTAGTARVAIHGTAPAWSADAAGEPDAVAAAAGHAVRHSPTLDAVAASVAVRPEGHPSRESIMGTLKKDHVAGTGGSAVAGGATGAAIGAVVGGPIGLAVGAVAGTAVGAIAGHKASNAIAPDSDLGHFEDIFESMPYYVREMKWSDYAPAYRYGLDTYRSHGTQGLGASETSLEAGWPKAKGGSRLLWSEARAAVAHAWRALDESMRNDPD